MEKKTKERKNESMNINTQSKPRGVSWRGTPRQWLFFGLWMIYCLCFWIILNVVPVSSAFWLVGVLSTFMPISAATYIWKTKTDDFIIIPLGLGSLIGVVLMISSYLLAGVEAMPRSIRILAVFFGGVSSLGIGTFAFFMAYRAKWRVK